MLVPTLEQLLDMAADADVSDDELELAEACWCIVNRLPIVTDDELTSCGRKSISLVYIHNMRTHDDGTEERQAEQG